MSSEFSKIIKTQAQRLGFSACGIAKAEPVEEKVAQAFKRWIANGNNADMHYLENYEDKRLDPCLLMEGVKSIVCVALNYAPAKRIPEKEPQIAAYAYGKDYHYIVKEKLQQLAESLGITSFRAFSDSAPILERYWAVKAGLGWIGKNRQLVIPHAGSMFFLGELFIEQETTYDTPLPNYCGNCRACIDACPTGALADIFDAKRCISYQTIENRGEIPSDIRHKMGNSIYGCDRCQQACPHNRFAQPTDEPLLQPSQELLTMTEEKWLNLTEEDYQRLFKGSAVKRAKYSGMMRNINTIHQKTKDKKD